MPDNQRSDDADFCKEEAKKELNVKCCGKSKEAFDLFCKCSSVRGLSKLRTGSQFLKCTWTIFVLSMSCLLIASTASLIKDFLNYDVSVQTKLHLDEPAPFPALTVCHQTPFSEKAYEYWNQSKILSPGKYNRYLRDLVLQALHKNDLEAANMIWMYDSLSVYYQNLEYAETLKLGHSVSIFLSCMRTVSHQIIFEGNCSLLKGYTVRRFSNHLYMNCYTFEPDSAEQARETTSFSLVVSMGPRDKNVGVQPAFFSDVFDQARGLRIVVHEVGTAPDLEKNGLHVEPGKLNEVNYEPLRWKKLDTPKKPCIDPNETNRYTDLSQLYNYTHEHCLLLHQQREIMNSCQCMYVILPRPTLPGTNLQYCGRLWPSFNKTEFSDRINCLGKRLDKSVKEKYDGTTCLPRCKYYEYPSTTTITKWRVYPWQLYWLRVQNDASTNLNNFVEKWPDRDIKDNPDYMRWELYLKYGNLTHIPTKKELTALPNASKFYKLMPDWPPENIELDGDDFAYVVVKRKSQNVVEKTEKLVLTSYVLVSRIGGLCSLTIGITLAFVVELVEFIYLLYADKKQPVHCRSTNKF